MVLKRITFMLCSLLFAGSLSARHAVLIDKYRMQLALLSVSDSSAVADTLWVAPIACGRRGGHKQAQGDMRTPEGAYYVTEICDARQWGHDFNDGLGYIEHAYGPWFFRLSFGSGIGIHGTHAPQSMGLRATEGCIRLKNDDLERLRPYIEVGTPVTILPDRFELLHHAPDPVRVPNSVAPMLQNQQFKVSIQHVKPSRRRHRR